MFGLHESHAVIIIDCHDSANAESRNDENLTTSSLRGEAEAIHNLAKIKLLYCKT